MGSHTPWNDFLQVDGSFSGTEPAGMSVLSGDGRFMVVRGTERYRNARVTFRTLFWTGPILATRRFCDCLVYATRNLLI